MTTIRPGQEPAIGMVVTILVVFVVGPSQIICEISGGDGGGDGGVGKAARGCVQVPLHRLVRKYGLIERES